MNFIAFVHVRIYQCASRDKKECKDWKFFLQARWNWKDVMSNDVL